MGSNPASGTRSCSVSWLPVVGSHFRVLRQGSPPPEPNCTPVRIILIHGFVCDARFWGDLPRDLCTDGHEVVTPDLPYHGGSTEDVAPSLEGMAAWLVEKHLQSPVVLVGHSLGGMIALQIVHDHPDLVAGLALVDSFPSLELNAARLPGLFAEGRYEDTHVWIMQVRDGLLADMTQATHDTIWPTIASFDARPWLPGITCPVLGLYGGRGRYSRAQAAELQADLLLDQVGGPVEVAVVENASHFVQLEEPQETFAILRDWLARHFQ